MKMLFKMSYLKINFLLARIEVRGTLNALGLCSDKRTKRKNKEDFANVLKYLKDT